jgi:vacuolar-type H+-ATPase subunit E/Vma4
VKGFGSLEAVLVAIQEDARAEIEKIETDTDATLARLHEEEAHTPVVVPDADVRIAVARRQARERLAEDQWADRQAALNAREIWIGRVAAEGQKRLLALAQEVRRREISRFAGEAAARLTSDQVDVLVAVDDEALTHDAAWRAELEAATGKHMVVTATSEVMDGGCIVRTSDGRIRYDNTYAARARRFELAWRAALGTLFDARSETPNREPVGDSGDDRP